MHTGRPEQAHEMVIFLFGKNVVEEVSGRNHTT